MFLAEQAFGPSGGRRLSRRRLLVLTAVGGSAALLAACGGGAAPAAPTAASGSAPAATKPTAAGAPTTAAVPAATKPAAAGAPAAAPTSSLPAQVPPKQGQTVVKMMSRGDDYIFKLFRKQYDAFSKEHPDIYVQFDDSPGDWYQKLQLQIASGTPPDAMFEAAGSLGSSYRNKIVDSVDPNLAKTKDFSEDAFDKSSWFAVTYGGKRWGLPWDSGSCTIFFNIDLFNAAQVPLPDPKVRWTWDQMLDAARKLTLDLDGKRPGETGFNPGRIKQYGLSTNKAWGLMRFIFGNGGEPLLGSAEAPQIPFDTDAVIDGIQWLADLSFKHHVAPDPAFAQSTPISFGAKSIAMNDDGVWSVGRVNQSGVSWGVMPFPKGKVEASYGHYSPLSILTASKVKDATWTWTYWATLSEPGQAILVDAGQMQPMRKSLHQRFLDNPAPPDKKYKQVFVDELESASLRVPGDKVGSFWGSYNREWTQVTDPIYDKVFRGAKTMRDMAPETKQKLDLLLKTGKVT